MHDRELLNNFVKSGSRDAFADLVRRYIDLVYAAALRQTQDSSLAEDVTQQVFVLFARKANRISPQVVLAGWLLNSTRYIARTAVRAEARRKKHERKAIVMRDAQTSTDWDAMSPLLDDALEQVPETNRLAVVLKYLQGKTSGQVGEQLGISEEAARKRISRGVEELREIFRRRGIVTTADALGSALGAFAVKSAPPGLVGITSAAVAKGAAASKSAAALFTFANVKVVAASVIGVTLIGGATAVTVHVLADNYSQVQFAQANAAAAAVVQAPAAMVNGVVVDPSGKPVSDVEVLIGTAERQVSLGDNMKSQGILTDAEGKFSIPKPDGPFAIVALSEDGIVEVSWKQLETNSIVTLKPWATIEGVMKDGDQPRSGAYAHLWRVGGQSDPWERLIHVERDTKTDAEGRFTFQHVPPGQVMVYRQIRNPMFQSSQWNCLLLEPGKTIQVNIGGTGAAIIGHVVVPDEIRELVDWRNAGRGLHTYEANLRREDLSADFPAHGNDETPEQYRDVENKFVSTPQGKLAKEWMFGSAFEMNEDGSFRVNDLPPGKYSLNIRNFEDDPAVNFMEDVASTRATFEIKADQTQPLDLGALKCEAVAGRLRPGQVGPDFSVTTVEGKTWKLADQKGKVVVLIFWGTGSNTQELPVFSAFNQQWKDDKRIAIMGIFADDLKTAHEAIEKYDLHFEQTAEGGKLMGLYNSSWPEAVIVGLDGKIVQKHLKGKTLDQFLQKALGSEAK